MDGECVPAADHAGPGRMDTAAFVAPDPPQPETTGFGSWTDTLDASTMGHVTDLPDAEPCALATDFSDHEATALWAAWGEGASAGIADGSAYVVIDSNAAGWAGLATTGEHDLAGRDLVWGAPQLVGVHGPEQAVFGITDSWSSLLLIISEGTAAVYDGDAVDSRLVAAMPWSDPAGWFRFRIDAKDPTVVGVETSSDGGVQWTELVDAQLQWDATRAFVLIEGGRSEPRPAAETLRVEFVELCER